uniref:LITAF domain-containing protein n=1 Tax=Meloidogyne hapla TaxID=6305 RepID=A0A1I8BVX4_MELHA
MFIIGFQFIFVIFFFYFLTSIPLAVISSHGIRQRNSSLPLQQARKKIIDKSKSKSTSLLLLNNLPQNSGRQPDEQNNYCPYCNKCLNKLNEEINIKYCFAQNKG